MSYSIVEYVGDGIVDTFTVPFPYIDKTHVNVNVNGIFAIYHWETSSTLRIVPTPANGAFVKIQRESSQAARLVDFKDGTILTEKDLDLANTQNFYIVQEALDLFKRYIEAALIKFANGNGVTISVPAESLADQIVADVLASQLYTDLSSRIVDIDGNAETLAQLALRDYGSLEERAFIKQEQVVRETETTALASYVTTLLAAVGDNTALIQSNATAIVDEASARASDITTVQTNLEGNTASIQTALTSVDGLEAQYTVKIDNNGYVSGFGLASYPSTESTYRSDFTVLADQFSIVSPSAIAGEAPVIPFVVGTSGGASTVGINGQLIVNGTIYADSIATGTLTADKLEANSVEALVGTFSALSAAELSIGTAPATRLELSPVGSYPLWYGTGTKNDLNGVFYVKDDGSAKFSGALEAASGTFSGDITGSDGIFSGTLDAASLNIVGTGHIKDLAVDTLKIAGRAVTYPVGVFTGGTVQVSAAVSTVQTLVVTNTDSFNVDFFVTFGFGYILNQAAYNWAYCQAALMSGSTYIYPYTWSSYQYSAHGGSFAGGVIVTVSAGQSLTLALKMSVGGVSTSGTTYSSRYIHAVGLKR